ncbi:hypothetical protein MXD62_16885 [Frankia sp. Mgl5]|uniref:hypothetical protein n=1 Tax=Frankia sp. Mgl5 TaxID=2933793 RepID=UPI00200CEDB0|nr:hypothetical protein [Frankia sp. Mgl5]MCK9928833.1 hypothetical protein [Frankia sp. Mgl5]
MSLLDYNNGVMHGVWMEAEQDVADSRTAVNRMLARSPTAARASSGDGTHTGPTATDRHATRGLRLYVRYAPWVLLHLPNVLHVRDVTYESHGVPLKEYQLTRADHRRQEGSEDIRRHVDGLAEQWRAEEAADPVLRAGRQAAVEQALKILFEARTPDHDLMRWRVRLYCGHITETQRHAETARPTMHGSSSMKCPECSKDPSTIVAYEPIGFADQRPVPPPALKRPTRAQLERRLAELEAEVGDLRSKDSSQENR